MNEAGAPMLQDRMPLATLRDDCPKKRGPTLMRTIVNQSAAWMALALLAMSGFAHAQQDQGKSDWDKIVLEEKAGSVMTSNGGEYQTASIGKQMVVGEHMMLSGDKPKAKVVYYELDDEGRVVDKCIRDYVDPNVYIIDATCKPVAAWMSGNKGIVAGTVAGAALIGGAMLGTDEDSDPVSTGAR